MIWTILVLTVKLVAFMISPSCYAITEDSDINGCDYRNGAWYRNLD